MAPRVSAGWVRPTTGRLVTGPERPRPGPPPWTCGSITPATTPERRPLARGRLRMALTRSPRLLTLLSLSLALTATGRSAVPVAPSYTESFDTLGAGLPAGWGVWTDSTVTGNGTAFAWNTATVANNAGATATSFFRNLPGSSQAWTSTLSAGSDRALGWRAGTAASRDGSISFTWADTAGWSFSALSFDLFTPNDTGTAATFNLEYQLGAGGSFSLLSGASYTTRATPTAPALLEVTTFHLSAAELRPLNDQAGPVTLRLTTAATVTTLETVALDNFSYTATAAIPEPGSFALLGGAGALGLALVGRRRRWCD